MVQKTPLQQSVKFWTMSTLRIAVEGCCHGELDTIYQTLQDMELREGKKVDLLLICGDFQSVERREDLESMHVPNKYKVLGTFYKYVTGEKKAFVPTIFIGGNHEASNILQSLYYGGYVAPNIYFLGFAGVVNFRGLRISGVGGLHDEGTFKSGHFERPPYDHHALKSVYYTRELEIYRMALLSVPLSDTPTVVKPLDVVMSHEWPSFIWNYGNRVNLLKEKPFFETDMASGRLGSIHLMNLLHILKPSFWFCAHLHCKFAAIVPWATLSPAAGGEKTEGGARPPPPPLPPPAASTDIPLCSSAVSSSKCTRFLSLDKVLPGRDFLQIIEVEVDKGDDEKGGGEKEESEEKEGSAEHTDEDGLEEERCGDIEFDAHWMCILQKTHNYLTTNRGGVPIPSYQTILMSESNGARHINISNQDIEDMKAAIRTKNNNSLIIPNVEPVLSEGSGSAVPVLREQYQCFKGNVQTDKMCDILGINHVFTTPYIATTTTAAAATTTATKTAAVDENELDIDDL